MRIFQWALIRKMTLLGDNKIVLRKKFQLYYAFSVNFMTFPEAFRGKSA